MAQTKEVTKQAQGDKAKMDQITKGLNTKSAKIRALRGEGFSRSAVAKYLDIRYQHVRNVEITPVKQPTK